MLELYLDLFCDIKFVRDIFIRWISCNNEVLCHVASRTLSILFSHCYLTPDQFLDLAELVLGVHEEKNAIFGNVEVTMRASRAAVLDGVDSDSSSSVFDSDYDQTPEPAESHSDSEALMIQIGGKEREQSHSETMDSTKSNKSQSANGSSLNVVKEEHPQFS